MTIKQEQVLKNLPKTGYNLSKAMKESGYTEQSSKAGSQYKSLRRFTSKIDFLSPERIKKDIEYVFKQAKKENDITNMSRNIEHRSKIAGMITDKIENKGDALTKVVIAYTKPGQSDDRSSSNSKG